MVLTWQWESTHGVHQEGKRAATWRASEHSRLTYVSENACLMFWSMIDVGGETWGEHSRKLDTWHLANDWSNDWKGSKLMTLGEKGDASTYQHEPSPKPCRLSRASNRKRTEREWLVRLVRWKNVTVHPLSHMRSDPFLEWEILKRVWWSATGGDQRRCVIRHHLIWRVGDWVVNVNALTIETLKYKMSRSKSCSVVWMLKLPLVWCENGKNNYKLYEIKKHCYHTRNDSRQQRNKSPVWSTMSMMKKSPSFSKSWTSGAPWMMVRAKRSSITFRRAWTR